MSRSIRFDRRTFLAGTAVGAAGLALWSGGGRESDGGTAAGAVPRSAPGRPVPPPANPFLARSVVPIGHGNSAQTNGVAVAGPTGPTKTLVPADLDYQFIGPGHFGIAISPPYPDGSRVIWSNGGDRIAKLDYRTLDVLAELPVSGAPLQTSQQADAIITQLDGESGAQLATTAVSLAAQYLRNITGVYYLLDKSNTLFVSGASSVIAYRDAEPGNPSSPIVVRDQWAPPAGVPGGFVGANMTFDGKLVVVTDQGWLVVVDRDFTNHTSLALPGSQAAAAHNQQVTQEGLTLGSGSWVRNSVAADADGGIYVASLDTMHKVVWTGEKLSVDPRDGAWSAPYLNGTGLGTGATPALMGFGDEDQFVVITDGQPLMNVVLYWRNQIPSGWKRLRGAPNRRVAGMLRADMGNPNLTAIQTQQGVVVGGYGAFVVNNEPASIPAGFPAIATQVLTGYAGADDAFTPRGMQKFEWDPAARVFRNAWVNTVSSPNSTPIVSTGSNTVYTVGARNGQWTLEGVDWTTGKSKFHWVTGSSRYNSNFSGINLDQEGRIIHTTEFGIVRYDI